MNKLLNAIFLSNKIVKLSWLKNISTNIPNIVVYLCTIHLVVTRKYQHKCILQQLAISSTTFLHQVSSLRGEAKHSHKSQNQHPLEGSTQRKQNGRNKTRSQRQRLLPVSRSVPCSLDPQIQSNKKVTQRDVLNCALGLTAPSCS
jgi:hypothetical protein